MNRRPACMGYGRAGRSSHRAAFCERIFSFTASGACKISILTSAGPV